MNRFYFSNLISLNPIFKFQISGKDVSSNLALQAHECRTISIIFCPTMLGPAFGNVCFHSTRESDDNNVRVVKLFGYGGNTALQLLELSRGPVGSPFISFGNIRDLTCSSSSSDSSCHQLPIQQRSFVIYNRGPLDGMAVVRIKPSAKDESIFESSSNIVIRPDKCVIGPDSYQQISVTFQPRRSDLKKLMRKQSPILTFGVLEVIYGDDPNRQRVARLIRLQQQQQQPNAVQTLDFLLSDFPFEQCIDFEVFDERTVSFSFLKIIVFFFIHYF